MVGGMSLDPGEYYYGIHDNRAATRARGQAPTCRCPRWERPVQPLALSQPEGIVPIEYVRYEAEQEETPIILVQTDTLDTMARLDTLLDGSRFKPSRQAQPQRGIARRACGYRGAAEGAIIRDDRRSALLVVV